MDKSEATQKLLDGTICEAEFEMLTEQSTDIKCSDKLCFLYCEFSVGK